MMGAPVLCTVKGDEGVPVFKAAGTGEGRPGLWVVDGGEEEHSKEDQIHNRVSKEKHIKIWPRR